ncbi:hypothetical protein UFOVP817_30 [uncultured Caudovirales phage]|uniref:Uncharacterized protein n=1 Tax=uncultured Caudovirales phage TaxID=2100421 RepID=A0A6J5P6K3_9CAUD|nr:hypothetical protein UFOVP817_30 [uncultured Caudovirales phage]
MKSFLKNWKTSLAGLFGVAAVVVPVAAPQHTATLQQVAALAVSLGLLAAKDGDKTGV